ncbi:carbohydrate sulfotransferase 1-like [Pelobates fuscus]|uniref:carbohydrate sulfotransferase 1-like n=1 Tax=Pelobates fuscus TaxID=191477 RepID=UPI002FE43108
MECSWKAVLLLVFASLGIQYSAIKSLRKAYEAPCPSMTVQNQCLQRDMKDTATRLLCEEFNKLHASALQHNRKHILIFATTRTGSSFLGQIFNQNPDIFYLFEPLYHVQKTFSNSSSRIQVGSGSLVGAFRDLLQNLYNCDFYFFENYISPTPKNHVTSTIFRRGSSNALCSPPLCDKIQRREHICSRKCRPLNFTLVSESCKTYKHIAIKTVRIPKISDLRTLVEDPRLNLKIIHLVRDPRGILASRISTFIDLYQPWKIWNSIGRKPRNIDLTQITSTCADLSSSVATGLSRPPWLKGRYMLVRYEDIAMDPVKKAKEMYDFLGLEWREDVQMWIEQNTNGSIVPSVNFKYSTSRNSAETSENWRLHLCLDIVQKLQELCNVTFSLLGYKMVDSVLQLKNLSNSLVEPRIFFPFT